MLNTVTAAVKNKGFNLISDNKAQAIIVTPANPSQVVNYAVKELNWHLKKASGVELPVITEDRLKPSQEFKVYLGNCNAIKKQAINTNNLAVNQFIIKTTPNAIFMFGSDGKGTPPSDNRTQMGTLFAVYEWLQLNVGVKWLWPGTLGTIVPHRKDINSGPIAEITGKLPFITTNVRHYGNKWQKYETNVWLRRHRIVCPVSRRYGHAYINYWKRFGKTHPEYFALRPDGVRAPLDKRVNLVQMCVSNSGLQKQIIADWLIQRKDYPELPWINGAENDRRSIDPPCQCAKCQSWDAKSPQQVADDSPYLVKTAGDKKLKFSRITTDRYAKFWLALQAEGRKYDPDATVVGYAYSNYTAPPVETKLNKNIIIFIVPRFNFPLFGKQKVEFRQLWDGWAKTGARLILRPNYFLEGYCMPYIYAEQFGEEFKYAYKNGLIGTDFDSLTGMWGVQGPNLYMLGRLLEKPSMPIATVMDEYYSGFGPAAKQIRDYFSYWRSVTNKVTQKWSSTHDGGWSKMSYSGDDIYRPDTFLKGFEILSQAKVAAATDSAALARVEFLERWLEQARLAMDVLGKFHTWKRDPSNTTKELFIAAKKQLDKYRKQTKLGIVDTDFLKLLEKWSGWRTAAELEPVKMTNQQILDSILSNRDCRWKTQTQLGICSFGTENTAQHNGKIAAFINCTEVDQKGNSWARYYTDIAIVDGKKYTLTLWLKTSIDFNGVVMIWPPGTPRTTINPTKGKWQKITIDFIAGNNSRLYLNLWNGQGKVWFRELEINNN